MSSKTNIQNDGLKTALSHSNKMSKMFMTYTLELEQKIKNKSIFFKIPFLCQNYLPPHMPQEVFLGGFFFFLLTFKKKFKNHVEHISVEYFLEVPDN